MGCRLGVPTRPNRRIDEVHEHVEGTRSVRSEKARWADHACQPVGLLKIPATKAGEPARLPGKPFAYPDSPWRGPANDVVGQFHGPFIITPPSRDHGLQIPAGPDQGLVPMGLPDLARLTSQLLGFIPIARLEI